MKHALYGLGVVVAVGCLSHTVTYSSEDDAVAVTAIEKQWSVGGSDLVITLCEDVTAPESDNDCQVEHVVRGDGRGSDHSADHGGGGCGGCPFSTVAYVKGTVSGGGLTTPVSVTGEVTLSATSDDNPYVFPYDVQLRCDAVGATCFFSGTLHEDGRLEIRSSSVPDADLVVSAAASCP